MRVFIAIEISDCIRKVLEGLQHDWQHRGGGISWTRPENIHLTLRFLGEIDEVTLGRVVESCRVGLPPIAPFSLRLGGVGFFPNARRPRVIHVGLSGEVAMVERLQREIEDVLESIGIAREGRLFRPHLTLGRVRSGVRREGLATVLGSESLPAVEFEVRDFVVMRSELRPAGSLYTPLATISLQE